MMDDDPNKTMPPRRQERPGPNASDVTMPGKRDRKPDGRFEPGDLIMGRYKVLSELGQGGMGVVYKCFDETAGIEIALKALPPELSYNTLEMEDIKENFQLVHNLHHPNIASSNTLEKDNANGNYYLIMECVEGEDLRRWIKRKRKEKALTLEDVLPVIGQAAGALDYAHEQRIIHRDIKPGNIMIDQQGKIKVLDFGLAAQIHTSMTRVSMAYHGTSGTGPYMAPEQWRGRAQGAAADQYALAVMTYEMLAGHLPFESTDPAVLQQAVLTQEAEAIPNLPKPVKAALDRGMSKEPSERFESCADFVSALSGKKIGTKKTPGKMLWFALAAVILLSALGGGYGYYRQAETRRIAEEKRKAEEAARKREAEAKRQADAARELKPAAKTEEPVRPVQKTEAELDTEFATLKSQVESAIQKIDGMKYDRGQTFGEKLDRLHANYRTANNAKLVTTSIRFLRQADESAKWLLENGPLREKARALIGSIARIKKEADILNASELAPADYRNGAEAEKQAQKAYEAGVFQSAISGFETSLSGYDKAYKGARKATLAGLTREAEEAEKRKDWEKVKTCAARIRPIDAVLADGLAKRAENAIRQGKLDGELAAARKAKERSDWQTVIKHADLALKIDSGSAEARKLREEALENLDPTIDIHALVNGKDVDVSYKTAGSSEGTKWPQKLQKGKKYHLILTHRAANGDEFTGKLEFICDWNGPKEFRVPLVKVAFNGTVELPGNVKLEMVKIKAGTFTMGSPEGELGRFGWEKQHQVTLTKDYWLGKYEVTQGQWQAVMGNNPSKFQKDGNYPVETVSWEDAKKFCDKLNERYAGKLPRGYRFDLPSEAQWEYACRAGTTTALNNGKNLSDEKYNCENLNEVAWYDYRNKENSTHAVGGKRPNAWGLYDMHGNVWEWCRDWDGSYDGDATDPTGPESGSARVSRGGSWYSYARSCRSAYRNGNSPGDRDGSLGFRLALVSDGSGQFAASSNLQTPASPAGNSSRLSTASSGGAASADGKSAEPGRADYLTGGKYAVKKDYAEAVKWYRKAAEQGYAKAQYMLGMQYFSGRGVKKDYSEAVKWYRKAAEQGYANAQKSLGICYSFGYGVKKDPEEAARWYRKVVNQTREAAEKGDQAACFSLGLWYEFGTTGLKKNRSEAIKWYRKAAEKGHTYAKSKLEKLER